MHHNGSVRRSGLDIGCFGSLLKPQVRGVGSRPSPFSLIERGQMANPWFRFYSEFEDDAKVQLMSEADQRRLVLLFCQRCKEQKRTDIEQSFKWRVSLDEIARTKAVFVEKGFIDQNWNLLHWDKRQAPSDFSRERTKRWRKKTKNDVTVSDGHSDGHVTSGDKTRDGAEERRGEENREEKNRGEKTPRPKAKDRGELTPLVSIFQNLTPRPPLPRTKDEAMSQGYVFSNMKLCNGCGEEIEWWAHPAGRQLPLLGGKVHLGSCSGAAAFRKAN